ncbi:MAG: TrkH family potassium uptake protein [Oscillospiraceae bacterium]|nr:TrkH family potassium uptake protein [Oscillospiraceae bacterium]
MNYRIVGKTTATVMLLEAVCLIVMAFVSLLYRENALPFLYTVAILCVLGGGLYLLTKKANVYSSRVGFVSVMLSWLVLAAFGALPFYFNGGFGNYINCIFEATSGFTTTGATILDEIASLPRGILMWRSFTHFIGGMGILVLTSAILPSSGNRAHYLMQAEVPGPTSDKLVPSLAKSSKILYAIYCSLTIIMCAVLMIAGLPLYDALCVSFSTAGTGGFAVLNDSIAGYGSVAVKLITSVFMLLFSINFTVYFLVITGKLKRALKSEELRFFLALVAVVTVIIGINIYSIYGNAFDCFVNSFFVVSSTISTTGFTIVDYNFWPALSQSLIVIIMFCGACAGSTGGGIKSSRIVMLLKSIVREIKQIVHPKSVNIIRLDGKAVGDDVITSALRFVCAFFAITLVGTLLISVDNYDFTTNFTAVLSCMSNVGPGLGAVGPICNFAGFSGFSKLVMTLCMLIGRLEIFPILIFFSPSAWKKV